MPAQGIHHVDLAVSDVERSLAFYLELLGPLGLAEDSRCPTYRGTEEAVYLRYGDQLLGLHPADGGEHHYQDGDVAYARVPPSHPARYRDGLLPD
jgi:catechol 2,3-dioxygenase-like lactoylglutathione lyase family enzyme